MSDRLLVTTEWLAEHLDTSNLRIVDIRGHILPADTPAPHYYHHREAYLEQHIPGAVFIDWVRELTDPESLMHARVAGPERFAELMSRMGIDENTCVVCYDDAQGMFAARLWWALNYYGHDNVAVLDGGWEKWLAEGHPTNSHIPDIEPTAFTPRPNPDWIRSSDDVEKAMQNGTQLLDLRPAREFVGMCSRARRNGHIPKAVNIPRRSLISAGDRMLSSEKLRDIFAKHGIDSDSKVIVYSNAGISSSYGLLALHRAGITNAAVYDGSWKDWANDESKPIE